MLNQIVNRLQGQVRIRVETTFPERVLNLCGARNLAFWDMEWESETAFTCRLNRRDYYALRRAVKQLDCRLTVVRKEGVPFFLGRFRRRHGGFPEGSFPQRYDSDAGRHHLSARTRRGAPWVRKSGGLYRQRLLS